VSVERAPRKQTHTRPRTNHSRLLDRSCGNSSIIAVITPSNPANCREEYSKGGEGDGNKQEENEQLRK